MNPDYIRAFDDPRLLEVQPAMTKWGQRRQARQRLRHLLTDQLQAMQPTDDAQATLDVLLSVIGEATPEARLRGYWVMNSGWKQKIIDTAKWDKPYLALYGHPIVLDDSVTTPELREPWP